MKFLGIIFSVLTLGLNVMANDQDAPAINPGHGASISPIAYKLIGATVENRASGDRIGLVCLNLSAADGVCKGYRYVEIPATSGTQWKALGDSNFTFRHNFQTVELKDLSEGFLTPNLSDYDHFWATTTLAGNVTDLKEPFGYGARESYASFATGYGMIFGLGEVTYVGAAIVDFGQVVAYTTVDALHAVFVTPFQAMANSARKHRNKRDNKMIQKMGNAQASKDNVKVRDKRYTQIRDAIDESRYEN